MADKPDSKRRTVKQLVEALRNSMQTSQAAKGKDAEPPRGPYFTFLVGAGFSLSAGVPTTGHLTAAMERLREERAKPVKARLALREILESTAGNQPGTDADYYQLMNDVLGDAAGRQAFITAAVQWASGKQAQVNQEAILLASLLTYGAGREAPLKKREGKELLAEEAQLLRGFIQHVFTTNFDEVLPTAFYWRNWPVEVIDHPGAYTIHGSLDYPAVVYLHGRHLHYDIRNTRSELAARGSVPEQSDSDLFSQFRQLLARTGLIVAGYSGAEEDLVIQAIRRATQDRASLPHNLYWVLYKDENSISSAARELVRSCERAYFLVGDGEQLLDARLLLTQLYAELGADATSCFGDWAQAVHESSDLVSSFLSTPASKLAQLIERAQSAYQSGSEAQKKDEANKLASFIESLKPQELQSVQFELPKGYSSLADLQLLLGQLSKAKINYQTALGLHLEVGDKLGEANVLQGLGDVLTHQNNHAEARERYEQALALYREFGDKLGEANDLLGLGGVLYMQDDYNGAREKCEQALALHREAGDKLGEANGLLRMSKVLLMQGDYKGARENCERALVLHREEGSKLGEAADLQQLGALLRMQDEPVEALEKYELALALHREVGDKLGEANAFKALGDLLSQQGDHVAAREKYEQALVLHSVVGSKLGEANDLQELGDVLRMQNDHAGARERYEQALALHRELGDKLGEANDLQGLGTALRMRDDHAEAREKYEQALALHREVGGKQGEANDLQALGGLAVLEGRMPEAKQFYVSAGDIQAEVSGARGEAGVYLDYGWYLLLAKHYDASIEKSEASLMLNDDHMPYFNISHAKWIKGDVDAVEHYRAGIKKYGGMSPAELADFDEFVRRGLTTSERVAELKQALGLE